LRREVRIIERELIMTEDDSTARIHDPLNGGDAVATVTYPDPEYPDIPYPIIRPIIGSPYYISPRTGWRVGLSPPDTPPLTSEDVRLALEDFP
jgi:hypothetical protein